MFSKKGTENWHIAPPDAQGWVEVGFRVKTRGAKNLETPRRGHLEMGSMNTDAWLEKSSQTMKVRRFALKTSWREAALARAAHWMGFEFWGSLVEGG